MVNGKILDLDWNDTEYLMHYIQYLMHSASSKKFSKLEFQWVENNI